MQFSGKDLRSKLGSSITTWKKLDGQKHVSQSLLPSAPLWYQFEHPESKGELLSPCNRECGSSGPSQKRSRWGERQERPLGAKARAWGKEGNPQGKGIKRKSAAERREQLGSVGECFLYLSFHSTTLKIRRQQKNSPGINTYPALCRSLLKVSECVLL